MEGLEADLAGAPRGVLDVARAIVAGYGTGVAPVSAIEDLICPPPPAAVSPPRRPPSPPVAPKRPLRAGRSAGSAAGGATGGSSAGLAGATENPPAAQPSGPRQRPKRPADRPRGPAYDPRKIPRRLPPPPVAAEPWCGADFPDCLDGCFADATGGTGGTNGSPEPSTGSAESPPPVVPPPEDAAWEVRLTAVPPPGTRVDPFELPSLDALVKGALPPPRLELFRELRCGLPRREPRLEPAQGRGAVPKYDRERASTVVGAFRAHLADALAGRPAPFGVDDLSGPELLGGNDGDPELMAIAAALREHKQRSVPRAAAAPAVPGRRKRKESWTTAMPPAPDRTADTRTPERPRSWHGRHLAVVSFAGDRRGVSPRPVPGQFWTVGRLKANNEDHIGGVLESDLPETTAIHTMLMAGSATVDDVPGNPAVAAADGIAAFCVPARVFPWDGIEPPEPGTLAVPREAHTRSRMVMILVGSESEPSRGDLIMIAGAATRFSSQIIDPANGQVIADQPPIQWARPPLEGTPRAGAADTGTPRTGTPRAGTADAGIAGVSEAGIAGTADAGIAGVSDAAAATPTTRGAAGALLVEVAPCRHPQLLCWGIVKRVATLGRGILAGTIVTSRPPPTGAQLDAYRRDLTADAYRRAAAVCGIPKPPHEAVEHYLDRCGSRIGIKPADIRAAAAAADPAASPTPAVAPPDIVARMAAMWRWKNTPATERRNTPATTEREANFRRYVDGHALLCCGGEAAWVPNGLTPVAEPIKPSTRYTGKSSHVVDDRSFPYETAARTSDVNRVKSKATTGSLSGALPPRRPVRSPPPLRAHPRPVVRVSRPAAASSSPRPQTSQTSTTCARRGRTATFGPSRRPTRSPWRGSCAADAGGSGQRSASSSRRSPTSKAAASRPGRRANAITAARAGGPP